MRKINRLFFIGIVILFLIGGSYAFLKSIYVVPVLMYHHIDEYSEQSKLSVSPESFEKQMKFLREHRYNIVSLDELAELIKSKKSLPHKTIVVTFDDGYKDNYTEAFPALKKYNIPAAVFVAANKVGREGYMDWQELEEMVSYGVGVGSHTLSECYLPDIKDKTKLRKEIYGSREIIRSKLPQEASFIAYCSGGFNEKIRQMVIDAGYTGACATNPGKDYPDDDIFALKRVRISRTSDNLFVFWIESSGFYTWLKEIRDED